VGFGYTAILSWFVETDEIAIGQRRQIQRSEVETALQNMKTSLEEMLQLLQHP
jgi:hypothetical protein